MRGEGEADPEDDNAAPEALHEAVPRAGFLSLSVFFFSSSFRLSKMPMSLLSTRSGLRITASHFVRAMKKNSCNVYMYRASLKKVCFVDICT